MRFKVYRFNPQTQAKPAFQDYDVRLQTSDRKVLDALVRIKEQDDSLSFRRSCREGVCGSDAMNINGRNALASTTSRRPSESGCSRARSASG
jgi:succinate dehydrogenase / fumarate reductase iron-sulfur subunit